METREQKIEKIRILKEFIKREIAFVKWLNNKKRKSMYDKEHLKYCKRTLKNAKQELKELEQELKELEDDTKKSR